MSVISLDAGIFGKQVYKVYFVYRKQQTIRGCQGLFARLLIDEQFSDLIEGTPSKTSSGVQD